LLWILLASLAGQSPQAPPLISIDRAQVKKHQEVPIGLPRSDEIRGCGGFVVVPFKEMQTSLIDFLLRARERGESSRSWLGYVLLSIGASLVSLLTIAFLTLLLAGFSSVQAILLAPGGVVSLVVLLIGVFSLGEAVERLEKERGVSLSAVIRSSGFALIRSQPKERAFTEGTADSSLRLSVGAQRYEAESQAMQWSMSFESPRPSRWSRVKAALRSSGFSVIRENLPDKDSDRIG
jgi:hypothetical protein